MRECWPFAVCLAACGGATASATPPPETITVAPPAEPPTTPARMEPPQWMDASASAIPELTLASPTSSMPAPDAGARPTLRIGAVTVTGARTADLVQKALLGATPEMSRCHEAASDAGPRPAGIVRIRLVVAASGQIVSIAEVGSRADRGFVMCVLDAARRVKFTRAVGGNVEVNFPVQFGP